VLIDRLARAPRRVPVLFAALVAGCALIAGCGSGPNQAGSAAIVGASAVPLSDVQRRVDAVLARPDIMRDVARQGGSAADIARYVVTTEVQHLLLAEAARRDGIAVGDQQIDTELAKPDTAERLTGQLVLDPAEARDAVRDQLIAQALAAKYLDRLSVTVDVTVASSREEATAKARQLAAGPAQADALLASDGHAQRNQQLVAASTPQLAGLFLFGTPAGQVVAVQTSVSPDVWTVLRVTRRDISSAPPTDPNSTSVSQLGAQSLDDIGRRLTQPLAEELGVRVNPRYGTWDPTFLAVVPPGQQPSVVLPAVLS
jgi:hypothetical protein